MTTTKTGTLYIALELGWDKWLLTCATQAAQKLRYRSMPARNLDTLRDEIAKAKQPLFSSGSTMAVLTTPCC
jgi:hypothetical protein